MNENFFGREKEIDHVWKRIKTGNNLILPSPRRVGKTSFALRLLQEAENSEWHTVHVNLEKISNETDFIDQFIKALQKLSWWEKSKERGNAILASFGKLKTNVNYADVKFQVEWQAKKKDIYTQLSDLLDHEEPTLIFFDEVTVLLNSIENSGKDGKKNVTSFLHWLRDLRITPGSKIRWIYCSSVGIENFTHRLGISKTLNDFENHELKSYTDEESIKMLKTLGDSNELILTDDISKTVVARLEYCLPFFLQLMFKKIQFLVAVDGMVLDDNIVDKAYDTLITESEFNTWIERIEEQYYYNKQYAFRLLKHICEVKEGVSRSGLVNILVAAKLSPEKADEAVTLMLYMLMNDGYLMHENGLYRFRSPLLRDFWFNRFLK